MVILYLLLIPVFFLLLLLIFPVTIHVKAQIADEAFEHSIRVSWLGLTVNPERFRSPDGQEKKEKKEKEPEEEPKKAKETAGGTGAFPVPVRQIPQLVEPAWRLLCDLWRAVDFPSLRVNAVFGFDDPANTGVACGYAYAAASVAGRYIPAFRYAVTPVFHETMLDVSVSSTVRIRLYRIVFAFMNLFFSGDGRRAVRLAWKMRNM